MPDHISKQFDQELGTIRSRVLQMGGLVEQQIRDAMMALETGDAALIKHILGNEQKVNDLEVEVDDLCNHILARRQPTAGDLRMVLTAIKMVRDLERIGDEAEKISRMAQLIHDADRQNLPRVELTHMATVAVEMLHKILDAFARMDVTSALQVMREDLAVDDEFRAVLRQLITYMMEDPRTISRSIELLFGAKAIERIGDHCKNMSEHVVYLVKGRDVRHQNPDKVEKDLASG